MSGFLLAASTGLSVASQIQQGRTVAKQAAFQRTISDQNAEFATELGERNAQAALNDAGVEEARSRRDSERRIASATARAGASGVQISGSPLLALVDQVTEAEEDALLIRHGGEQTAINARIDAQTQSRDFRIRGSVATFEGQQAKQESIGQAGGTLPGGTAKAINRFNA